TANVPTTVDHRLCSGLRTFASMAGQYTPSLKLENVTHRMTITPAATPVIAAKLPARRASSPSRNSPNSPPLKIPANSHHTARTVLTAIIAKPTPVQMIPHPDVDSLTTHIDSRSPARGRRCRL